MPIRINCKHCGKKFSAWDDLVGKSVKCPKCQQEMLVPGGDAEMLGQPSPPPPPPSPRPATSADADAFSVGGSNASSAPITLGEDDLVEPAASSPYEPLPHASGNESESSFALPMPPVNAPRPAAASTQEAEDDLDDLDDLPFACPSCNQPMPPQEDLCDNCGYHRILKKKLDMSEGIDKPDKSTGFERVFRKQLEDPDSAESMMMYLKVAGAVLILGMLFVCGWVGWVIATVAVIGYVVYRKRQASTVIAADSTVNQDALSRFLWQMTLSVQRVLGWRKLAWPFPQTKALILHDASFTDADLADIEELPDFETLDLEGTQISNAGLRRLESMKQLRYLVLLKTNVSAGGVQKLQQALPDAWIWF